MVKEKFKSKGGFILASIGAAVGLGNALRFPGLCAKYGGGAFLLIYFVALVILGVPLLNAEIALGRKFSGGAPKCMSSLKKGGEKLGWASCVNSLLTAVIYAGLAGWLLIMVIAVVPLAFEAHTLSQNEISGYFFSEILYTRNDPVISGVSLYVCLGIACAWGLMFFCLRGGAGSLSKAAKLTVFVPMALLTVMAVRGMFYENAKEALAALFLPDFSALSSPELWVGALGQVFFSLSVAVGIMPAFGSYLPEGTDIFRCSLVIAAADFFVSVLASVVMFTTLYGCGAQGEIGQSAIITAFSVYPVAICSLFGGNAVLNSICGVLFYSSLSMLAVQSAVSMAEAFVSPFASEFGMKKKNVVAAVCILGGAVSLVYANSAAAVIVSITDRFVNFYNVLVLGAAECLLIGWCKEGKTLSDEVNRFTGKLKMPPEIFRISLKFLSPAVLFSLTITELIRLVLNGLGYPAWAEFGFGWGLSLAVAVTAIVISLLLKPRPLRVKRLPPFA